jgi:hypothetical protein
MIIAGRVFERVTWIVLKLFISESNESTVEQLLVIRSEESISIQLYSVSPDDSTYSSLNKRSINTSSFSPCHRVCKFRSSS